MKECQENKISKAFLNLLPGKRNALDGGIVDHSVQCSDLEPVRWVAAASLKTMATLRGEVFPSLTLRRPSGSLQNANGPNRGP